MRFLTAQLNTTLLKNHRQEGHATMLKIRGNLTFQS